MADRDPPPAPVRRESTSAVLRLLGGDIGACVALLVAAGPDDMAAIEDASPMPGLAGERIRMPAGLLSNVPVTIETMALRLSTRWTELCGARPAWLASAPVPHRSLHIVVASATAPDPARLTAAADLAAQLLRVGQMTGRERDESMRVAALVAHLPAPMLFVDSRTSEVILNDRARSLLGIAPGEARIATVATALRQLVADAPDAARSRIAEAGPGANLMFEIAVGARRFQVESRWIDEDDLSGRIWLFRDITTEKSFQARLTDLAALLEQAVEHLDEGVMLIDRNDRIILWNEAFIELFDLPSELVDQGAEFLPLIRVLAERGDFGPGPADLVTEAIAARIRSRAEDHGEGQRANGRIVSADWIPLPEGRFMFCVRDVTTERLSARFKEEMISTVSHELRTPLTAISGSLGLLRAGVAGDVDPKIAGLIEIAHRNSDRLTILVNDLLDMDKLHSGKLEFHFAAIDLRTLLEDAAQQNAPYAQGFGVAIDLDLPEVEVIAEVDGDRILQVMSNLLSNAAKFSPEGSRVRIRLAPYRSSVRISVIDQGRGMSPEFRHRLFTRFAQEDRSAERGQAGTGLGLAISKSIVDHHHGAIEVHTRKGHGTTFHIDLPRTQDAAAASA